VWYRMQHGPRVVTRIASIVLGLMLITVVGWRIADRHKPAPPSGDGPVSMETRQPVSQIDSSRQELAQYLSGEVTIGINGTLPGWSLYSDPSSATGFDVALVEFLQRKYGFTPRYEKLRPWEREDALRGRVKLVLANYSMTKKRDEVVDFAGPYFYDRSGILCSDRKLSCDQPIPQRNICVTRGTVMAGKLSGARQEDSIVDCMKAFYDTADRATGAIATDHAILTAYGHRVGSVGTVTWSHEPEHPISDELYGIGLPNNSPQLCRALSADIDEFLASKSSGWDAAFRANLSGLDSFGRKPPRSDGSWCHGAISP
jgi:glutamate transport system substrate-binding protein